MSRAGFTYDGVDPGDPAQGNLMLVQKRVQLVPKIRDRIVTAGTRPGIWDFGSELAERRIELEIVSGDNATVAGTDLAMRQLADLFDPTRETIAGDKGYRQLILDSENDRYWLAKLVDGPFPEYLPSAGRMVLTMRCSDPFAYSTAQYVISGGGATLTGFGAYRQAPTLGLAWNLLKNGGFNGGAVYWTPHANAAVVVDGTSPTGQALRTIATGTFQSSLQSIPVEAGKAYSFAAWIRTDGAMHAFVAIVWKDANGTAVGTEIDLAGYPGTIVAAWTEFTSLNNVAPGNARTADIVITNSDASGIAFVTALRAVQAATVPAWGVTMQSSAQKGLAIYDGSTNILADGDMEAVGTASWPGVAATITKDTVTFFAGAKSLKIVTTAGTGYAAQTGALAAGQPITASVRHKQTVGTLGGPVLVSTPSNTIIGQDLATDADWTVRRASGVIAGGDTGWQLQLQGGAGIGDTSYFDNAAIENVAFDTFNADPSGQAFALAARVRSSVTLPLPSGFDLTDFSRVITVRMDHAYNGPLSDRFLWTFYVDANNYIALRARGATQVLVVSKQRAGVGVEVSDSAATAFAAGDTLVIAFRHSAAIGMELQISKNGAAIATYTNVTPEAKLPVAGAPTSYLGRFGLVGYEMDGTVGVDRHLKAGLTAAAVAAIIASPYTEQDETKELAVWRFEGAAAPEDFAGSTLSLEVGGTYWVDPVLELTAGGTYSGNITFTDSLGNVLTWNGSVVLNDVIKIESDTLRVRKNGTLSMSGVVAASKWPRFRGGGLRDSIVVGGISAANIKALTATWRNRWL